MDRAYRQYFTECFDPSWKGRHLFKWIWSGNKSDRDRVALIDQFLDNEMELSLLLGLALYRIVMPHNDGWMELVSEERKALAGIKGKIHWNTFLAPNVELLVNPLCREEDDGYPPDAEKSFEEIIGAGTENAAEPDILQVPKSGLDKKKFDELLVRGGIGDYITASQMLLKCDLPEEIADIYRQLIARMVVLEDSVGRFDQIYHANLSQFHEYYAPEALKITAVYLDYQAAEPSEEILKENRDGVFRAAKKLLQVVNEKIDEIYQYVTIDANAEAKALEAMMSQAGHVDPEHKI